jgi:hypothetical protein
MIMSDLPISPSPVSVTGIERGEYFAVDVLGHAMIYLCRTCAHGVVFDDRQEPKPFRATECYCIRREAYSNIEKLKYQCITDRNNALGIKEKHKTYVEDRLEKLAIKYNKDKRN